MSLAEPSGRSSTDGETSRRRTEGLLRATLESIDDGVLVVSQSGRVSHYNARFTEIWALPEALLRTERDQALLEAVASQLVDPQAFLAGVAEIRAGEEKTHDILRFRDGRILERFSAPLPPLGEERERMWLFRDVTASLRAADALRASQELLTESQRAGRIGSWELDISAGTLFWTDECYRIYGYAPGEIQPSLGLLLESLALPADRAYMEEHYRRTLATREFAQPFEFRIRLRSGETRWVHVTGAVKCDPGGVPVRLVGTQQDITDRKRNEEERLELERRLLHSQKLESLGVLAGGIAHDFNNLLAAIQSNLDLAMECRPGPDVSLCLDEAALAVRKAASLTHQMLAYSGRARSRRQAIDLATLVEENARLLRSSMSKLISVKLALDPALPRVAGDPAQIQQLVMNLMINAAEAIGDRDGTISVGTGAASFDRRQLELGLLEESPAPGRFVFLEVADDGCGMDAPTMQRLFDPFFTTKAMGRGLGMSAIQGIIRGHKGTIFVDSAVGRGTVIRVLLPAQEGPVEAGDGRRVASPGPGEGGGGALPRRGVVLVVDDEEGVRQACARMIRGLGWTVLTAADGVEAVSVFRDKAADVACVILDLSMPRMNGVATFRELRALRGDVRVILSSGYPCDQEVVQAIIDDGLAGFIQKPYELATLDRELRRVLAGPLRPSSPAQAAG